MATFLKSPVVLVLLALFAVTGAAAGIVWNVPALKWRAELLSMQLSGRIYDLSTSELFRMMWPGSGYYLEPLTETGNPFGVIANPHDSPSDVTEGARLFRESCSNCHGADSEGGVGPALNQPNLKHGASDWALFRAITRGIPGTAMKQQALNEEEAWQTVAFIRATQHESTDDESENKVALRPLSFEDLLAARENEESWLTYSGAYDGWRYSELDQLNVQTAAQLRLIWMHQTDAPDDYLETSPIVHDGVMYITVSPGTVEALDAATGKPIWSFTRPVPSRLSLCCGTVNRGVALLGTTLYWGTIDAHLVALDAETGRRIWETEVADHTVGYSITSAPLVLRDKVLIGVSGGEYGIRGHLDAYDSSTGERVWRFYTIPGPGEPGHETWKGESWKRGGAGAWLTGSYDPERNLVYWGTGNPAPLYYGDDRLGDNLYANSVVALDADTGALQWHFQFTPHDLHDWAANQIPILVDREWRGNDRALLLTANRNGFFYALNRSTGEFLSAQPFVKQNWALSIDETGRPTRDPAAVPTPEGVVTWPSPHGGTNWQSPAYSPKTGLFYVAAMDGGRIVYKQADTPRYTPGEYYLGSMHQLMSGDADFIASTKAIDPESGEIVWQYNNPPRKRVWRTGGLLATAGDIIFGGDYRSLYALDATDGRELWRMNIGGYVNAAPITYEVDGQQRITVAAGRSILTFGLTAGDVSDGEPKAQRE